MNSTKEQGRIYFQQLKIKVRSEVEVQLQIRKEFKDWSVADIQYFQDDLEGKCKSTVSEKWVYNHFKNENENLPRVDVLNLLSVYCGYKNWDDFKFQNQEKQPRVRAKRKYYWVVIGIGLFSLGLVFWVTSSTKETILIFRDAYTHQQIKAGDLQLDYLSRKANSNASVLSLQVLEFDTLRVDGAYYKAKEIILNPVSDRDTLEIELLPDDYALMLNYFSRATSDNWEKRRKQLDEAIHDEAKLFQVHADLNGIEMLNKHEFIDRLILPVNSLKNLEIQHIIYKDNQIYRLRFIQKIKVYEHK